MPVQRAPPSMGSFRCTHVSSIVSSDVEADFLPLPPHEKANKSEFLIPDSLFFKLWL